MSWVVIETDITWALSYAVAFAVGVVVGQHWILRIWDRAMRDSDE